MKKRETAAEILKKMHKFNWEFVNDILLYRYLSDEMADYFDQEETGTFQNLGDSLGLSESDRNALIIDTIRAKGYYIPPTQLFANALNACFKKDNTRNFKAFLFDIYENIKQTTKGFESNQLFFNIFGNPLQSFLKRRESLKIYRLVKSLKKEEVKDVFNYLNEGITGIIPFDLLELKDVDKILFMGNVRSSYIVDVANALKKEKICLSYEPIVLSDLDGRLLKPRVLINGFNYTEFQIRDNNRFDENEKYDLIFFVENNCQINLNNLTPSGKAFDLNKKRFVNLKSF